MKKSIFLFLALVAGAINVFADDCVKTDIGLDGTATITFSRYTHKTLTGLFSVSSTKQVFFSQGNLQYQASSGTWRFAENQWDRIGQSSGNTTVANRDTQSGWIDLFFWGTSGWDSTEGSETYAYRPWEMSGTFYPNSLTDGSAEADWAWHNSIINGGWTSTGPAPHQWRTLTQEEWNYLFTGRSDASTLYGMATLMGRYGVIILPDSWSWTDVADEAAAYGGFTFTSGKSAFANVIDNSATGTALWNAMEEAGAVFLPVTGKHTGASGPDKQSSHGHYYSSTSIDADNAYTFYFYSTKLYPYTSGAKNVGCAVRAVRDL